MQEQKRRELEELERTLAELGVGPSSQQVEGSGAAASEAATLSSKAAKRKQKKERKDEGAVGAAESPASNEENKVGSAACMPVDDSGCVVQL